MQRTRSEPSLEDLKAYPGMTRWFDPRLLLRLLARVTISSLLSQYTDRRAIVAALDKRGEDEVVAAARIGLVPDRDGAVWIDYVADLGDGFDSTYAIASLLAQDRLAVSGPPDGAEAALALPRGGLLIMGGDQVYPTSSREGYNRQLRDPYKYALPPPEEEAAGYTPLYLIPGNHDWYDGLVAFQEMFCRAKGTTLGGWRTGQRRSYFALNLVGDWWLWAIDIALTEDMDQAQAEYFVTMADRAMPEGARIILCSAEPGWYEADRKAADFRSLDYAAKLADNAGKSFRIVLVLSGDSHHYARYESGFGTQFVTAGGGGAFLHGTHSLKREIKLSWLRLETQKLSLKAAYPSPDQSRRLLRRDLLFPVYNLDFAATVGVVYGLMGWWLTARPALSVGITAFLALLASLMFYSGYQERGKIAAVALDPEETEDPIRQQAARGVLAGSIFIPVFGQAVFQFVAIVLLAWTFSALNAPLGPTVASWASVAALLVEMVPVGGLIGASMFGVHLWITSRFFDTNHGDAFSALRIDGFKNFVRLRIRGDTLTVFPVGLDRVPRRDEWQLNPAPGKPPCRSVFLPPDWMGARLIEPPVEIRAAEVGGASDAVRPETLAGSTPGPTVGPAETASPSPSG